MEVEVTLGGNVLWLNENVLNRITIHVRAYDLIIRRLCN